MERNRSDLSVMSNTKPKPSRHRLAVTNALVNALFEEWARAGFAALSLESVAARAGAGKAAIYRRWSSKSEFVHHAMSQLEIEWTNYEDMGTLEGDLRDSLLKLRQALRHPLIRRIHSDLVAEIVRSTELRDIAKRISFARRSAGTRILERAIARGELPPEIDIELALDFMSSPLYWRMVTTRRQASIEDIDKFVKALMAALRAM